MHTFSDFWTACAQVRSQFSFLGIKYPLSITSDPTSGLTVSATTVFRRTKAKARISFTFDDDTLGQWPFNIQSLKSEVKVIYGTIEYVSLRTSNNSLLLNVYYLVHKLCTPL